MKWRSHEITPGTEKKSDWVSPDFEMYFSGTQFNFSSRWVLVSLSGEIHYTSQLRPKLCLLKPKEVFFDSNVANILFHERKLFFNKHSQTS